MNKNHLPTDTLQPRLTLIGVFHEVFSHGTSKFHCIKQQVYGNETCTCYFAWIIDVTEKRIQFGVFYPLKMAALSLTFGWLVCQKVSAEVVLRCVHAWQAFDFLITWWLCSMNRELSLFLPCYSLRVCCNKYPWNSQYFVSLDLAVFESPRLPENPSP